MKRETKSFSFELKGMTEAGEFSGIASVYGNVDLQGDAVQKGAFTKTLAERGTEVPILWQHDQKQPIGLGTLTDSADGLLITGKLDLDVVEGQRAYSGLKKGYLKGLSIGYDVVKQAYAGAVRKLTELKLYEVSTVTFPANEMATVQAVKQLDPAALAAAFDFSALPEPIACQVKALVAKAASLSDRVSATYRAVRAAFPLSNAYPLSDEIYDDHVIVSTGGYDGDTEYFSVAITAWDEDGCPTLGDAVEVVRAYVAVNEASDDETETAAAGVGEVKAGRVISSGNATKLKAAAEHMEKAAAHVADVIAASAPKTLKKSLTTGTPAGAAESADEPLLALLSAFNDGLRASTH